MLDAGRKARLPLNLYTSNRMEVLLDSLATTLRQPLASAFTKEVIVVQSRGMQRWLSMELAARFCVWANGHYLFPNAMVQELFSEVIFTRFPQLFQKISLPWDKLLAIKIVGVYNEIQRNNQSR